MNDHCSDIFHLYLWRIIALHLYPCRIITGSDIFHLYPWRIIALRLYPCRIVACSSIFHLYPFCILALFLHAPIYLLVLYFCELPVFEYLFNNLMWNNFNAEINMKCNKTLIYQFSRLSINSSKTKIMYYYQTVATYRLVLLVLLLMAVPYKTCYNVVYWL